MTAGAPFEIVFSPQAQSDLRTAYENAAKHSRQSAGKWLDRFEATIDSLGATPDRCPVAHENDRSEHVLRELLFGKRPHVFRVIFWIAGAQVRILRIRRASRRFLTRPEIQQAADDVANDADQESSP